MNIRYYKGHLQTKRSEFLVVYQADKIVKLNEFATKTDKLIGNTTLTVYGQLKPKEVKEYLEEKNGLKDLVITNLIKL